MTWFLREQVSASMIPCQKSWKLLLTWWNQESIHGVLLHWMTMLTGQIKLLVKQRRVRWYIFGYWDCDKIRNKYNFPELTSEFSLLFTIYHVGMKYFNCTKSWYEQRQFLDLTVASLGDNPVVKKIKEEFAELEPHKDATIPSE